MAQIMNFKRMEVVGATKEEALGKAPFNVNLPGADCTQALRNYKKTFIDKPFTDADLKQFMLKQLQKKTRNTPGNGCYIVVDSAVADTRERPYRIDDVKNEKGARKYKTIYQLVNSATGAVVAETDETKAKAKELAKELYTKHGFKGNLICTYTKQVVDGEPIAFKASYTPSKSSRVGTYLVFGIEGA